MANNEIYVGCVRAWNDRIITPAEAQKNRDEIFRRYQEWVKSWILKQIQVKPIQKTPAWPFVC